jgi:predicted MPP superfamily phosphohydrolase
MGSPAAVAVAAIVATALLSCLHVYLWRRLVRDVSAPAGWYRRAGTVVLAVLPVVTVVAMMGERLGVPWVVLQVVAWPGLYWLISLLYVVPLLLLGEALRPLLLRWLRRRPVASPTPATTRGLRPPGPPDRRTDPAAAEGHGGATTVTADSSTSRNAARPAAATVTATADPATRPEARHGAAATATAADDLTNAAATGEASTPSAPAEPEVASPATADASATTATADPDAPAPDPAELSRRRLFARGVAVTAGVVSASVLGYGTYAARHLTTKHVTVQLANLPRAAHGYRIAVASDIHLGPISGRAHCQRVVDALNATQPDLITVVGDLVDGEVDDLRSAAAPLAELVSREGSFFVTGNHEYFTDTEDWIAHVRELGLAPLENERRELTFFDLAGVNDLEGEGTDHGGPDFEAALGDRDPQRTSVLMAHQPAQIHDAVDYGVDLQLSGHTHGGQVWPVHYLAALSNPTLAGLERFEDTQLYVTRGAGSWGPPVRVGADPDITVITLASPEA